MQVRPYKKQDFHDIAIIEKMAFGTGAYSSLMLRKILNSSKGGNIVTVSGTIKKCKKSLSYTMENNIHLTPSKETP